MFKEKSKLHRNCKNTLANLVNCGDPIPLTARCLQCSNFSAPREMSFPRGTQAVVDSSVEVARVLYRADIMVTEPGGHLTAVTVRHTHVTTVAAIAAYKRAGISWVEIVAAESGPYTILSGPQAWGPCCPACRVEIVHDLWPDGRRFLTDDEKRRVDTLAR